MKKKIFALLALVMTMMTANAEDVPTYSLITADDAETQGTVTFKVNKVEVDAAAEGDEVTVIVNPATGWSIGTVSGEWQAVLANARRGADPTSFDLLSEIALTPVVGQDNQWTFTMQRANVEFSVTYKKVIQASWIQDIADAYYTGEAVTPTVTVKDGETTLVEDVDYTVTYSNNVAVCDATATENAPTVTIAAKDGSNYSGSATKTFTIKKKTLTVTAKSKSITCGTAASCDGVTYSGFMDGESEADLSGTLTYAYNSKADGSGTPYTTSSSSGTYYIIPSGLTSAKYDIKFVSGTLTVNKRSNSITQAPTALELTYTGEAQELVTAGRSRGGSWRYSLDGNTWAASIPTGTDAGTYTVYYKVNSSGTYSAISGSTVSVTIAPKTVDSPVIELGGMPDGGYEYDGSGKQPTVLSVKDGETEIPAEEYTVGYQNNVNAGTATVVVSDVAGGNYVVSGTQTFTINRQAGDMYIYPWRFEKTYGDEPFTIQASVTGDGALSYVSDDTSVATVDGNGRVTIVGTGTANIYVSLADGTNYTGDNDYCTVNVEAKIIQNEAGTTVTLDEDGYHATVNEGEGGAVVVVDEVTTATLDYGRTLDCSAEKVTVDDEQVCLYTVCLPYTPTATGVKYYTLSGVSGEVLSFREIEGSPQTYTPYVVAVTSSTQLETTTGASVDFNHSISSGGAVQGYELRGTLRGLNNANAAAEHAYVLQDDGHWHPVVTTETAAYIPPFRGYIVKTTGGTARQLVSSFGGTATGMVLQTIDRDGTERWYDLNGHQVKQPQRGGVYMKQQNGSLRKVIKR